MNMLEGGLKRIWFGLNPELRRSRFHTQKGDFALRTPRDVADLAVAVVTGLARRAFGWRPVSPWLTLPAIRFLKARLRPTTRVFEWGSGMSTLWFERMCREVHSVESDPEWFRIVTSRARRAVVYLLQGHSARRLDDVAEPATPHAGWDSGRLGIGGLAGPRVGWTSRAQDTGAFDPTR